MSAKKLSKSLIRPIIIFFYKIAFHLLSTKKNIILFESGNARNYGGNPRYIYEYLINSEYKDKFTCIWSLEDVSQDIPGNPIKVRRNRLKFLYYSIISNFWIFDSRHPEYLLKKKKCYYIQTWHGTPLKKLALDMDNINMGGRTNIKEYKSEFVKNSKLWDYLIAQNDFSKKIFKRAFDFKGKFLKIGYPRNDILINKKNDIEVINNIKKKIGLEIDTIKISDEKNSSKYSEKNTNENSEKNTDKYSKKNTGKYSENNTDEYSKINIDRCSNKKIILYAPTWRDNEFHSDGKYKFSSEMDYDLLKNQLSDEYIMIVKYHYLVKDKIDWGKYSDFIIVADEKWDIQELYLISDILITDYSSVMFDYSLLKKPILFYTYDLEFYKDDLRGFYFDLIKEAPGPILDTNEDLIEYLKNFNPKNYCNEYGAKYSIFIDKYNQYDDGAASKNIINILNNINK